MSSLISDEIKSKQFLVVDDQEEMRVLLGNDLNRLGITKIIFAKSGNEAFGIVQKNRGTPDQIDFILTDMMMADGTGIELTQKIRRTFILDDLPIAMITSKSDVNHVLQAVKMGVTTYVVKPWEEDILAKKIAESFSKMHPKK
jgi:two-component system, chemotaxis family, chemotaxis protein CheY